MNQNLAVEILFDPLADLFQSIREDTSPQEPFNQLYDLLTNLLPSPFAGDDYQDGEVISAQAEDPRVQTTGLMSQVLDLSQTALQEMRRRVISAPGSLAETAHRQPPERFRQAVRREQLKMASAMAVRGAFQNLSDYAVAIRRLKSHGELEGELQQKLRPPFKDQIEVATEILSNHGLKADDARFLAGGLIRTAMELFAPEPSLMEVAERAAAAIAYKQQEP
jgi:hypothetical protein